MLLNVTVILLIHFALLLLMGPFHSGFPAASATTAEQCPQWVNDEIQLCVQPVAEFARTLNQQQVTNSWRKCTFMAFFTH